MKQKPTKLETRLYDALENLICQLYADGPTAAGERRAGNAMNEYTTKYGNRHQGVWIPEGDPSGNLVEVIKGIVGDKKDNE